MIKIFKIFLSSILIASFAVGVKEIYVELSISNLANSPFHPDIKINNSANATVRQEGNLAKGSTKENYYGDTIIQWTNYANSWAQFQQYYQTIALSVTGSADGKSATKNNFTNLNLSVASLEQRSTWHDNSALKANGSQYCLAYTSHAFTWGSYVQSGVYYDAIVAGANIKFRFYLWTEGYQYGSGSLWTESHLQYSGGTISSSWKLTSIKDSLTTALANQINFESDYSGALEDRDNITNPTGNGNDETTLINGVIAKVLGSEYDAWKQYLQPFTFSNTNRQATIIFKFADPVTNQQQVWIFKTPINITLSHDYWGKSLKQRLHILPGQIVNPEDATKGMIADVGWQLEPEKVSDTYGGNFQYHTTARIEFDGAEDSSEWMTVNGEPVDVLNNKFTYNMVDNRDSTDDDQTNVYDIVLHHDNGNATEQYQIKYTINNLVPTFQAKWYAWNPGQNPEQKKLIAPTLPDGRPNPDYDQEINPKTGTKTQLIWVKKQSQYPFPLDPLNQNGAVIDPNANAHDYDLGFIAEGSVAGKGVQQLFNPNQVKTVSRAGVDPALNDFPNPNNKQILQTIIPDTDNKYWSWEGMWHYITKTSDGLAYEKYVLIGPQYQNKYPRFLELLDNSNVAVDFWTTIHGLHLKNYLVTEKNLDSRIIKELNYEQVASYWKEYTSDIIAQRIVPNPEPATYQDLSKLSFWTIKMNLTNVALIKQEIIAQVKSQLAHTKLIYQEDYELKPFDDEQIRKLLNYGNSKATIDLSINAVATSTKAIGSNTIKIINAIDYDPDNVFDLATITPWSLTQNFSKLTIEQLRENWILKAINDKLTRANAKLVYQTDYRVEPLDDETLQQFIHGETRTSLQIFITAQDESLTAINGTTLTLINDHDAEIAPPEVPDPNPKPNPNPDNNSWIAQQANLIFLSVLVSVGVVSIGTIIFLKYRLKKGIGGKKVKDKK